MPQETERKNKLKDKFDMMGNVKRDSWRQQAELTMECRICIEDTIKIKEFALTFYVHIDVHLVMLNYARHLYYVSYHLE